MTRFVTLSTLGLALILLAPAGSAQTKLTASNAANADFFGAHVAVSDDGLRAVVAAPLSEAGGATDTGALYVYSRSDDNSAWDQQAVLTASGAAEFDNLGTWINANPLNGGSPLAMSGDGSRIAAGALLADVGGNQDQGAVYVFTLDNGTWSQEAELTGAATVFTQFGFSIDLDDDGSRMVVGTRFDDLGTGDTNEGRAYVFDRDDNGTWSETARLTAASPAGADFFGAAVGISDDGGTVVVGAPLDDSASITANANNDAGAVYVFTLDNGTWSQQARIEAGAPVAADNLGYARRHQWGGRPDRRRRVPARRRRQRRRRRRLRLYGRRRDVDAGGRADRERHGELDVRQPRHPGLHQRRRPPRARGRPAR